MRGSSAPAPQKTPLTQAPNFRHFSTLETPHLLAVLAEHNTRAHSRLPKLPKHLPGPDPLVTRLTALDGPHSERSPTPEEYATPMQGERRYYTVEEAAKALTLTPTRIREMLAAGELEGMPPGATAEGDWKVLMPATETPPSPLPMEAPESSPDEQEEAPPVDEPSESTSEEQEEPADLVAPPAGSPTARIPDEPPGEIGEEIRAGAGDSGWTTTKQAAKVLGVSRRSVQGYVRRGLLEAREEGEGVGKTFLVSIDSLNALRDRRRREAGEAANFAEASESAEQTANLYANAGEALRHAIERVEARTAEATELRIRLEITEKAESTLRAELEEVHRRREEVEREREQLRRELEALRAVRESPPAPTPEPERAPPRSAPPGPQERISRPWWRRVFRG
jgi:hypothetical protein